MCAAAAALSTKFFDVVAEIGYLDGGLLLEFTESDVRACGVTEEVVEKLEKLLDCLTRAAGPVLVAGSEVGLHRELRRLEGDSDCWQCPTDGDHD